MTVHRDFKRLVRGRMRKTGESYTAARAQLLKKRAVPAVASGAAPSVAPALPGGLAKLAGMADEKVKAKTGRTWAEWVSVLDAVEALTWPHREVVMHVYKAHGVSDWWSQMVTVGYERIRGKRQIGQRLSGDYEATKSRTFPVSAAKVFRAFAQPRARSRWLPGVKLTVRKATPNKSIRITWEDGTSVQGWFTPKGRFRVQVAVAHGKLPDRETAERVKRFWAERLDALAALLV